MGKRKKIRRLLVANRAEIACRIIRTARELGIETVAIYAEPDRDAAHVAAADYAQPLGGDTPETSYLDIARILDAARRAKVDAVHPGYGFLAESAAFAEAVAGAGICFVGPEPDTIAVMGDKIRARVVAEKAGIPLIPSASADGDTRRPAETLGFPLLVKAAGGGGGRGMRLVRSSRDLESALASARREAASAFADDRVYLERYIEAPRHVEIQVFGDGRGGAVHFGERECSVQRRHQKVIEEAPSPFVDARLRATMSEAALELARSIRYRGAGTVEFVVDDARRFFFLEMNTRLQVEHPVTELVTDTDLVRLQIEIAQDGALPANAPEARGHALECRIYAEDPACDFVPTGGTCVRVAAPSGPGIRIDSALYEGLRIPVEYDPLLAKVAIWAPDRKHAIARMVHVLEETAILGLRTNVAFLVDVLSDRVFADGEFTTTTLETRFSNWKRGVRTDAEFALAAGALVSEVGPPSTAAGARGSTPVAGPWDTLGAWRLGTRRP